MLNYLNEMISFAEKRMVWFNGQRIIFNGSGRNYEALWGT